MQPDPIGYGDGLNMYGYVGGDPVNFTDPTGLFLGGILRRAGEFVASVGGAIGGGISDLFGGGGGNRGKTPRTCVEGGACLDGVPPPNFSSELPIFVSFGTASTSASDIDFSVGEGASNEIPCSDTDSEFNNTSSDSAPVAPPSNSPRGLFRFLSLGNIQRQLLSFSAQQIGRNAFGRTQIPVYRVYDGQTARLYGRSWGNQNPTTFVDWRDALAVYPAWNAGTYYASGTISVNDLITGAVGKTDNPNSAAGPQPYNPEFGGGPYQGFATEYLINNSRNTVQNVRCFTFE